ncbi:MAG: LysR family transcriptional regulator [Aestuariivirgaceae bacterium]
MIRYSLRQLEYFVLAASEGSLVQAAQRANVSQPSISAAISKLEDQLDVQLLIRHHAAGVSTTPAGAQIFAQARNLLAHAGELQTLAASTSTDIAGDLHLASFVTIAPLFLPGLIDGFAKSHPGARVQIHEATQDDLLAGLRRGRYELALLYDIDLPDDINIVGLTQVEPYVLLNAAHRLMQQDSISLKDLEGEPMILLDVAPSRSYFVRLMQAAGVEPNIAFSSPSMELVRGLVGKGQGYSLLVTRPHGDMTYDGEALGVRPIRETVEPGRIALASLAQLRPTRLMQAFTDYCVGHFAKPPAA